MDRGEVAEIFADVPKWEHTSEGAMRLKYPDNPVLPQPGEEQIAAAEEAEKEEEPVTETLTLNRKIAPLHPPCHRRRLSVRRRASTLFGRGRDDTPTVEVAVSIFRFPETSRTLTLTSRSGGSGLGFGVGKVTLPDKVFASSSSRVRGGIPAGPRLTST